MFHSNPHVQLNINQRNVNAETVNTSYLYNEIMGIEGETVAKKYKNEIKLALETITRTYDKATKPVSSIKIKLSTI
jgi:hypothetical protein